MGERLSYVLIRFLSIIFVCEIKFSFIDSQLLRWGNPRSGARLQTSHRSLPMYHIEWRTAVSFQANRPQCSMIEYTV